MGKLRPRRDRREVRGPLLGPLPGGGWGQLTGLGLIFAVSEREWWCPLGCVCILIRIRWVGLSFEKEDCPLSGWRAVGETFHSKGDSGVLPRSSSFWPQSFPFTNEDPQLAPHSSTLAWKIPWTEEPGRLQSMGSLGVRHDWATSLSLSCIGEGNGNPLQCSCVENPRDRGAWWAAVSGVAQSRTRLKRLSSSSSSSWIYWKVLNQGGGFLEERVPFCSLYPLPDCLPYVSGLI